MAIAVKMQMIFALRLIAGRTGVLLAVLSDSADTESIGRNRQPTPLDVISRLSSYLTPASPAISFRFITNFYKYAHG